MLNDAINLQLKEIDPIELDSNTQFPAQYDDTTHPELAFLLVKNKHDNRLLIRELVNIDYLLKVAGEVSPSLIKEINKKIRPLDGVVAAIEVDPKRVKGLKLFSNL